MPKEVKKAPVKAPVKEPAEEKVVDPVPITPVPPVNEDGFNV